MPDPVIVTVAACGLGLVIATAWRCPWARLWAALAIAQSAVVLATPSFFNDYPGFVAPAAALVLGTGLAAGAAWLARKGVRLQARGAMVILLGSLASVSVARLEGERLPLADIERDIAEARCVAADSPALLVLTSAMRRNLVTGCPLVLDPVGIPYDSDRGRLRPGPVDDSRRHAPGYQAAMVSWYTQADAALFVRLPADGLTAATNAAIERRLPVERRRGIVTVRLVGP